MNIGNQSTDQKSFGELFDWLDMQCRATGIVLPSKHLSAWALRLVPYYKIPVDKGRLWNLEITRSKTGEQRITKVSIRLLK